VIERTARRPHFEPFFRSDAMNALKHALPATAVGLFLAAAGSVHAVNFQSARELSAFMKERMPPFLQNDEQRKRLVGQMLRVPIARPLAQTFDPNKAIKELFGDGSVIPSTDCRRTGTPVGERDPGDCTASIGDENGRGAFSRLSYSKSLGFGNIKFVKRSPVPTQPPATTDLPSPKLTDAEAFDTALKFLGGVLGMPTGRKYGAPEDISEIPLPPAGGKLPVRNMNIQGGGDGRTNPITIQKVVFVKRGFPLASPIPVGNFQLTYVPGPGSAIVMFDSNGISGLAVEDWQDLRLDPTMSEEDTKSADALIEEIAEDLFNDGVRSAEDLKFNVLISSEQRNQIGLLLPAVQVSVVPARKNLDEKGQEGLAFQATGGLVKEYSLVNRKEGSNAGRPRPE